MRWSFALFVLGCSNGQSAKTEPVIGASASAAAAKLAPQDATAGVTLALLSGTRKLDVVKVSADSIDRVGSVDHALAAGWVDHDTLVTFDNSLPRDNAGTGAFFQRVVGSKVVDRFELPTQGMGDGRLVITANGEAWFSECASDDCSSTSNFQRIWPEPRTTRKGPPPHAIEHRVATGFGDMPDGPLPTAKEPSTAKLTRVKVEINDKDDKFEIEGVACASQGKRSIYPLPGHPLTRSFRIESTRWLSEDPPFYEVVASDADQLIGPWKSALYFRACETTTEQVQWLGGSLWGEHVVATGEDGTWVFWNGAHKIGTIAGTSGLRIAPR